MSTHDQPPSGRRSRATIQDVANAAGVSTTSVSHVFSKRRPVSRKAVERVLRAAEELNYQPSAAARGLATGRSFVFALYVPFTAEELVVNQFFAQVIVTVSTAASARGYGLIILTPEPDHASRQVDELSLAQRIDGVLLLDPIPADGLVARSVMAAELPIVTMGRLEGHPDIPCVDGDVRGQMTDVLDHFERLGCSRPALVTFDGEQSFLHDVRDAYAEWCDRRGVDQIVAVASTLREQAVMECLAPLTGLSFDALACTEDSLAAMVQRWSHSVGDRRVPIAGIGDSSHAQGAIPPLTSVDTHAVDRARLATDLLLDLIEGIEAPEPQITVPHELVARDTPLPRVQGDDPNA